MGTTQHSIIIDAQIKPRLDDLSKVVNDLRSGLEQGVTKTDLTKGVGKDLSKLINKFQNDYSKLKSLTPNNLLKISDAADFQKTGESIIRTFRQIQQITSDIGTKSIIDVKKMFPDAFDARVTSLLERIEQLSKSASSIQQNEQQITKLETKLGSLTYKLQDANSVDLNNLKKGAEEAKAAFEEAEKAVTSLKEKLSSGLKSNSVTDDIVNQAKQQREKAEKELEKTQARAKGISSKGITKQGNSYVLDGKNITQWREAKKSGDNRAAEAIEVLRLYKAQNDELSKQSQLVAQLTLVKSAQDKKPSEWTQEEATAVAAQLKQAEQLEASYKRLAVAKKESATADQAYEKGSKKTGAMAGIQEEILQTEQAINVLKSSIEGLKKGRDLSGLSEAFKGLGINFSPQMLENAEGIKKLKEELGKIDQISFNALLTKLKGLGGQFPDIAKAIEAYERGLAGAKSATNDFLNSAQQLEQLKSRLSYFFGIANGIQLFKRAVRGALNTVKELDAVMTETAVVTDFSVGDMWEKLPEYTQKASSLGASIKDLYSATTLYYQQGLGSKDAMNVGIETMKMARIAGLEAGDATQYMTAALRGFNMEVNEINAQRVNDVYSELAAITAADTSQIATAMSKTASIANAANMEFETTSALLAQIIETTQEAPETAGTAMKTIIARFTEVKQLFDKGMLSGEDEEGEEVNINKIDAALKTVGISLKDFLNGSKGIDDIFLELAEKWDTLDLATQRYIATTAAGSRQQSRFIAMMSNYDRTMELVAAANNSAGASQEQFDKTLESMEAKVQSLKDAWHEFLMGLANDQILKGGVTVLTTVLETINKILTFLSGGKKDNGGLKSILTLTTIIGSLKGGATILNKIFGSQLISKITDLGTVSAIEGRRFADSLETSTKTAVASVRAEIASLGTTSTTAGTQAGQQVVNGKKVVRINAKPASQKPNEQPKTSVKSDPFAPASEGAIRAAGAVTLLTGLLLNYAGVAIETNNGSKAAANGFKAAGTAAGLLGSAVTLLAPALAKMNASLGIIGLIALAITAVAAGIAVAVTKIKEASPEGQLKAAQEATQKASEAAEQATESYNRLADSLASVGEKAAALEKIAKGTGEYKTQLAELNQEMINLVTMYPALSKYVESRDGQLVFKQGSESEVQGIKNQYADAQLYSQSALISAQINELEKNENLSYDNLNLHYKLTKQLVYGKTREEIEDTVEWEQYKKTWAANNLETDIDPNWEDRAWQEFWQNNGRTYQEYRYETEDLAKKLASGDISDENALLILSSYGGLTEATQEAINALKSFGQELNTDEQKASVYQEAILNNAKTNVNTTEEQQQAMSNFLSSQDISMLVERQKNAILSSYGVTDIKELTDEQIDDMRKKYADYLNYEYSNGKMYTYEDGQKVEVIKTDDEVFQGLAGAEVQNAITQDMNDFAKILPGLQKDTDGLGAVFAKITSKGEGAALTFADLEKLRDYKTQMTKDAETGAITFATGSDMEALYNQVSGIWSAEEFYNLIQEAVVPTESREDIINRKTETMGISGLFEGVDIETGTIQGVVESLFDVFTVSGSQAAKNLGNTLDTEFDKLDKLDPKQAQLFAEGLNLIDWSNLEQVEGLDSILTDLGFDVDSLTIPIEDLENMIKEAAKSVKKFNLDILKEEIKATGDLIENLKDREDTERKFTKEEKERITKADESLEGQFVATGIDEFVYIGDSIDSLVTALNNNTSALLTEYREQVKYNADMSRGWEALKETELWTHGGKTGEDSRGYNSYDVLAAIATADSVSSGAELIGKDFALEAVQNLMVQLGMGAAEAIEKMSTSEMSELIRQHYDLYGSYAARQGNYDAETSYFENEEQIRLSQMSGQDILLDKDGIQEDKNVVLDSKITSIESGKVMAESTYEDLWKNSNNVALLPFKESAQDAEQYNNAIKATITDSAKLEKSMSKLSDTIKENANALKDSKGNSQAYQKALNKVAAQAKEVFGENYTEDFVEENLSDFIDWANGVEGSTERIRDAMIENLEESGKMTNEARAAFEALDGLQFNIYGYANVSEATGELYSTYEAAQAAADAIEGLGMYEVTIVSLGTDEFGVPTGYDVIVSGAGKNTEAANRSGGGGGGGGDKKKWENPYDEFYNTVEDINEELRTREKLERRYQALLDKTGTKASDLVKNAQQQIASLEKERKMREGLLQGRNRQMADIENEYSDLSKYAWYNEQDGTIEIDWNKIEGLDGSTDEELTSRIEEYIEKLEEQQDLIEEEEDAIAEIEEAVKEIRDQGKDEYFDLESQIRDALEGERQKEIDKLSEINDTISDTNSRLLDSIQESINEQRQERDNAKTEEELADKQRRLSYLQMDTSGANALEILELQKELEEGQRDYTDNLIDQKISALQKQNDEAAQQRQDQIDIMQAQLDHYIKSGEVWEDAYKLMQLGIDENGIKVGSNLWKLLSGQEDYASMSNLEKLKWAEEINDNVALAMLWLRSGNSTEGLISSGELKKGSKVTFTTSDGTKVTGTLKDNGDIVDDKTGQTYKDVYKNWDGSFITDEKYNAEKYVAPKPETPAPTTTTTTTTEPSKKKGYYYTITGDSNKYWTLESAQTALTAAKRNAYVRALSVDRMPEDDALALRNRIRMTTHTYYYKTGGLADFTGPAWLDGTKSRPEYVLNADQTRAFLTLVDVLEGFGRGNISNSQNSGDNTYDIDINVESIGSDYDVEQLANTVKRLINDDARYRNNNTIGYSR